ncbi:hypothetical protein [Pontibacter harenae]|uniref:hypothetical protein n=1 Tax=Pontibacter harenae TaxID=2894083 RepID=UPI001E34D87E|nr:hypothetical protein [Pontibacter harenae]MCC9165832.1 hypothetical protein [Pontibacter harenae]
MKADKDQNQGKESTADTNASYDRNAEELRNSATSSQNSATSSNNVGVGGVGLQSKPNTEGKLDMKDDK